MTLVIEDGTGVTGANSYVTAEAVRAYADLRGAILPESDSELEALIVLACDWVDSFRSAFQSRKTDPEQDRQFPRWRVVTDGYIWPNDSIPSMVISAQSQAVVDSATGVSLTTTGEAQVKREKVDKIEVEYFEKTTGTLTSTGGSITAEKLLEPLFSATRIGFGISTERY